MLLIGCAVSTVAELVVGNEMIFEQPAFGHTRTAWWWVLMIALGAGSVNTPRCGYICSGPVYLEQTVF